MHNLITSQIEAYFEMAEVWNVYENFQALLKAGTYHLALEGILLLCIIWLLRKKPKSKNSVKLSKKEEDQLLSEWVPEPLIPEVPEESDVESRIIEGKVGLFVDINGKSVLNLASSNYLNLTSRPEIEKSALDGLEIYGVGSCGPRGFYGTTEKHLALEKKIAEYFGCEMAILYSYGFSTISSAIPAYAKSGDIIYADECVNFSIQRGLDASRSTLVYFRHNDTEHLEELLKLQEDVDKKNPKKAAATRKFLVVEGVYVNTGLLCPLPQLVKIRAKYKLRLFMDESHSFGTIGPRARGVKDHFNVPNSEVDLTMVSLETAAACYGGFTVGTEFVVDHQHLSGLGYCFSASLPPMLAAASSKVFEILTDEGGDMVMVLQNVCRKVHQAFANVCNKVKLSGDEISPVKHLRLIDHLKDRKEEERLLKKVVTKAEEEGVAIVMAAHVTCLSHTPPPPSIRIAVNKDLTDEHIKKARQAITKAFEFVF